MAAKRQAKDHSPRSIDLHAEPTAKRASRADSGCGADLVGKVGSVNSSECRQRRSAAPQGPEQEPLRSRPATSSGRISSGPRDARKQSVSATPSKHRRQSSSRSSSIHSHRTRGDRPGPRRIHSSPVETTGALNIDDAIAFHERSCQLINAYYATRQSRNSISLPPTQREGYSHSVVSPPAIRSHSHHSHHSSQEVKHQAEIDHVSTPPGDIEDQEPVYHWTSTTSRRKEYAEIDRRNTGLRKWMRKFVPGCFVKPTSSGFYCETNESDAGSVRRFRLDLPDDENAH